MESIIAVIITVLVAAIADGLKSKKKLVNPRVDRPDAPGKPTLAEILAEKLDEDYESHFEQFKPVPIREEKVSPKPFLDAELKSVSKPIVPVTTASAVPVEAKVEETISPIADSSDPYGISHADFTTPHDWRKAIIASEILKTKF